jgi:hypothetical protein
MARLWMTAGLIALSLMGVGRADAQVPAALTPETIAAARELIATMRATDQLKLMLPAIVQAIKPAIVQGRPQVEHDLDIVLPVIVDGMNARLGEFVDQMAAVYGRNFTVDEMRQMTAFYRSPVGQKVLDKMPTVMQESVSLGQAFGKIVGSEMQNQMIEALRNKGYEVK